MPSEHIDRVRVFNGNPFQINDRFDGVPYEFPPGKITIIPPEAAQHIFGFPGEEAVMAAHMARRFGWNRQEHYKLEEDGKEVWRHMTSLVKVAIERYEVRRIHQPNMAIPAEEADDAPDMLGLNIDPPAPRRGVVGRRRAPRKRQLRPRTPRPATAPAQLGEPIDTSD